MRYRYFAYSLSSFLLITAVVATLRVNSIAEDSTIPQRITGKWGYTRFINDKPDEKHSYKIGDANEGGFVFHEEEFFIPGAERGRFRYTIPNKLKVSIRKVGVKNSGTVLDILLSHTTIVSESTDSFQASTIQADGRFVVQFDKPVTLSLKMPDRETRYELEVVLTEK